LCGVSGMTATCTPGPRGGDGSRKNRYVRFDEQVYCLRCYTKVSSQARGPSYMDLKARVAFYRSLVGDILKSVPEGSPVARMILRRVDNDPEFR
jgi:hypothetical protein